MDQVDGGLLSATDLTFGGATSWNSETEKKQNGFCDREHGCNFLMG